MIPDIFRALLSPSWISSSYERFLFTEGELNAYQCLSCSRKEHILYQLQAAVRIRDSLVGFQLQSLREGDNDVLDIWVWTAVLFSALFAKSHLRLFFFKFNALYVRSFKCWYMLRYRWISCI